LSTQAVPAGSIFSVAGKMAFTDRESELLPLLAITNSRPFDYFVGAFAGRVGGVQYEVGLISRVPVPTSIEGFGLESHASRALAARLAIDQADETSHAFVRPSLLSGTVLGLKSRCEEWARVVASSERELVEGQAAIDETALTMYGIEQTDREAMLEWFAEMG